MIVENTSLTGYGTWHKRATVTGKSITVTKSITVCGMITGCCVGQLHGVSNFTMDDAECLKGILKEIQESAIRGTNCTTELPSVLIATLGHAYWPARHDMLINVGFKLMAEYKNNHPSHRSSGRLDKQRMYMIDLGEISF